MPPFVLTVLKIAFLAILYFFVYRSVHAVASDMLASGRASRSVSAAATSRARIGPSCLNPFTLHPVEIAGQIAHRRDRAARHQRAGSQQPADLVFDLFPDGDGVGWIDFEHMDSVSDCRCVLYD